MTSRHTDHIYGVFASFLNQSQSLKYTFIVTTEFLVFVLPILEQHEGDEIITCSFSLLYLLQCNTENGEIPLCLLWLPTNIQWSRCPGVILISRVINTGETVTLICLHTISFHLTTTFIEKLFTISL